MKIIQYGSPMLRKKAKTVDKVTKEIKQLIDDMGVVLRTNVPRGVGLAAPQVGVSLRVIIVELEKGKITAFINPEIIESKGKMIFQEGCLSVPGVYANINRPKSITISAIDPKNSKKIILMAEDFAARVIQHEIDHLNGILFTDFVDKIDDYTVDENYSIPSKLVAKYTK
jgi:peptide deformylase